MIFGAVCLALTLLFFMGMVVASLFGYTVPENSRFFVELVVAFGGALGTGFLGGGAAVSGQLPMIRHTWLGQHPITFGASGGVAVLIVLLLIGPYIVPAGPTIPDLNIPAAPEVARTKDNQVIVAFGFDASQSNLDPRYQLRVQVSNDPHFRALVLDRANQITDRQFAGKLGSFDPGTPLWVRLAVCEGKTVIAASEPKAFKVP
jgi:hypothetical protein